MGITLVSSVNLESQWNYSIIFNYNSCLVIQIVVI